MSAGGGSSGALVLASLPSFRYLGSPTAEKSPRGMRKTHGGGKIASGKNLSPLKKEWVGSHGRKMAAQCFCMQKCRDLALASHLLNIGVF